MLALRRWSLPLLAVGLVVASASGDSQADAKKADTPERKALDATVHKTLRDIINLGADLYNAGDTAGCYRLSEGALRAIRPLREHRPQLQEAITKPLDEARKSPEQFRRAFVLRDAIDQIREDIRPTKPAVTKGTPKKEPAPGPTKKLWDRLGG